jgi:hypothetical protein
MASQPAFETDRPTPRKRCQPVPTWKRQLRVLVSHPNVPLLGECTRCSRRFKAQKESDRNDVVGQYEAHLCASEDVRRTGKTIVSLAGISLFN